MRERGRELEGREGERERKRGREGSELCIDKMLLGRPIKCPDERGALVSGILMIQ
jgi:hypothetical protein